MCLRLKRASPLLCVSFILVLLISLCNGEGWPYDDYDIQGGEVETVNEPQNNNRVNNMPVGSVVKPVPMPSYLPEQSDELLIPGLGTVRGKTAYKRVKGRPINSYLGLKYGVVRPGLGRFQQANIYESTRNDPIDATRVAPNCPQFPDLKQISVAEVRRENVDDCLTLNIHLPSFAVQQQRSHRLPVMVFVHGEMLFDGSAEEAQPDYFLEHDIILVSINYRLAPFGFLTTLSNEMPGNVALADIQLALEWIRQYIHQFGGDPQRVTLFGQAGGATLVHALSLSNKAEGLFHKLILQSGTALNPFFLEQDALSTARSFARLARCPRTSALELQSLHSCFERLSTTALLETMKQHYEANESRGLNFLGGFKLTVGDSLGYLPVHPAALVSNRTVPIVIGVAKDVGSFILTSFYDELARLRTNNISDYINVVLRHTAQPQHYLIWKNLALREIFSEADIRNPTLSVLAQGLLELTNLILYRGPVLDTIRSTYKTTPTYLYSFDYRGEFHRFGHLANPLPFAIDATLSDDNIYLFPYPEEVSNLSPKDRTISRALVNMWVDFAIYDIPHRDNRVWPKVTTDVGPLMRIVNSNGMATELDYHFSEGIPVPNLYPEVNKSASITSVSTSTTTTTTTTPKPYISYPHYSNFYPNYNTNHRQNYQQAGQYHYRPRITVLNGTEQRQNYVRGYQY